MIRDAIIIFMILMSMFVLGYFIGREMGKEDEERKEEGGYEE